MLGGPPRRRREPEGYGSLEASLLHCPRCRQAMPVRKRLLLGTTRSENGGRRVVRLEYEAFTAMAEREMRALGREAARRWPLRKVAVVHRVGVVPVGEASVAIAVSAAHRAEAFAACHWLIDR